LPAVKAVFFLCDYLLFTTKPTNKTSLISGLTGKLISQLVCENIHHHPCSRGRFRGEALWPKPPPPFEKVFGIFDW